MLCQGPPKPQAPKPTQWLSRVHTGPQTGAQVWPPQSHMPGGGLASLCGNGHWNPDFYQYGGHPQTGSETL